MSASRYVCFDCGLSVTAWLDGWKHVSGGANGRTPRSRRHTPAPVLRDEYERMCDPYTPIHEARALRQRLAAARGTSTDQPHERVFRGEGVIARQDAQVEAEIASEHDLADQGRDDAPS